MNSRSIQPVACLLIPVLLTGCLATSLPSTIQTRSSPRLSVYAPDICLDNSTGLMWLNDKSDRDFNDWSQARRYASGLVAGGFKDWRLPTHDELYILRRILDRGNYGECRIDLKGSYWTGDSEREARAGFWDSEPLCGGPSYFFVKRSRGAVLGVRMSKVPP